MSQTKEQRAAYKAAYYKKNKNKWKGYNAINRIKHRDKRNAYTAKWHAEHTNQEIIYRKEYEHTEAGIARRRKYYNLNKDLLRERNKEYYKKWHGAPRQRLRHNIANQIRMRLSKRLLVKTKKTFEMLAFTLDELVTHIESLFLPGMTWDNYGQWHIDHVIPDKSFDYSDKDQFAKCWALTNLQPLWAHDNLVKNGKYITEA